MVSRNPELQSFKIMALAPLAVHMATVLEHDWSEEGLPAAKKGAIGDAVATVSYRRIDLTDPGS